MDIDVSSILSGAGLVLAAAIVVMSVLYYWNLMVFQRPAEERNSVDEALRLSGNLFGQKPWIQIVVTSTSVGIVATAHDQDRLVAINGDGVTAREAIRVLCDKLRGCSPVVLSRRRSTVRSRGRA
jgi:hypothetical protein